MIIHKAYKFRLYPSEDQQILIGKTIGCSRFVFNHFLSEWNQTYEDTGSRTELWHMLGQSDSA